MSNNKDIETNTNENTQKSETPKKYTREMEEYQSKQKKA